MKYIVTIQHTQSVHHVNDMVGSWTDWELTGLGEAQAENIGRKLAAELQGQWQIYSSDLTRARQTATPLARYMNIEIAYLEKLREYNFGEAVGKSRQWMQENAHPAAKFDDRPFPGAESWQEFWNRVADLYRDIAAVEADRIILVSHAGVLAVWQQIWLGADVQVCKFAPAGSVSFMEISDAGQRTIQRLNDLSYIAEE
jgi:probable phosphoglycerate mutase